MARGLGAWDTLESKTTWDQPSAGRSTGNRVTHFEFITVAISIIYALSIARCLDALPSSFEPSRRYWVHFTWLCVKLVNPAIIWWSLWGLKEQESFSFAAFLGLLVIAATLYLQIVALVTTDPRAVSDWRSHYYAKRRLFFGVNIALLLQLILAGQLLFHPPSPVAMTLVQLGTVVLSGLAMISENARLHAWVAALAAINMFVAAFGLVMTTATQS